MHNLEAEQLNHFVCDHFIPFSFLSLSYFLFLSYSLLISFSVPLLFSFPPFPSPYLSALSVFILQCKENIFCGIRGWISLLFYNGLPSGKDRAGTHSMHYVSMTSDSFLSFTSSKHDQNCREYKTLKRNTFDKSHAVTGWAEKAQY